MLRLLQAIVEPQHYVCLFAARTTSAVLTELAADAKSAVNPSSNSAYHEVVAPFWLYT